MKKTIACFIALILLLSQLTSFAYTVTTTASSVSTAAPSTSLDDPYQKIHVYTTPDATVDYSSVKNESELASAIHTLKAYASEAKNLKETGSDIRITVQFTSNFAETEEFLSFRSNLREATDLSEVREIRKAFNSFSKKYHSAILKKNLPLLNVIESNNVTEIDYSPFVIIETAQETVQSSSLVALARNHTVESISLEINYTYDDVENEISSRSLVEETNTLSEYGNEKVLEWDDMLTYIGAKSIVDQGTYQGEGIRIGIIDSSIPNVNNPNLQGKDITIISNSTTPTDHATTVASIIARIAPQASLVCATGSSANIASVLSNMINENCDIVSISQKMANTGEYTPTVDGVFDYLIYNHIITVVKAAGNDYSPPSSDPVTSPGLAYNVITVGGVVMTESNQIIHAPVSCYVDSTEYIKPNVCGLLNYKVPYTVYSSNSRDADTTSFAAPQIAACTAIIMEAYMERHGIYLLSEDVLALIMSSARTTTDYQPYSVGYNSFDRRVGAGYINLNDCLSTNTVLDYFSVTTAAQNEIVYSETIHLNYGDKIQLALSIPVPTNMTGTNSAQPMDITDYNIYLMQKSTGIYVAYSTLSDASNHELCRWVAYESGEYQIIVYANEARPSYSFVDYLSIAYSVK